MKKLIILFLFVSAAVYAQPSGGGPPGDPSGDPDIVTADPIKRSTNIERFRNARTRALINVLYFHAGRYFIKP